MAISILMQQSFQKLTHLQVCRSLWGRVWLGPIVFLCDLCVSIQKNDKHDFIDLNYTWFLASETSLIGPRPGGVFVFLAQLILASWKTRYLFWTCCFFSLGADLVDYPSPCPLSLSVWAVFFFFFFPSSSGAIYFAIFCASPIKWSGALSFLPIAVLRARLCQMLPDLF